MHAQAAAQLRQQQISLAERTVELLYARYPEIQRPAGHPARVKSVRDAGYHLLYLAEALEAQAPQLFTEYLGWVKSLFANLHFSDHALPSTLACLRQALSEQLPAETLPLTLALFDSSLQDLPAMLTQPPSFIESDNHLARQFLDLLLQGRRHEASQLILANIQAGMPVRQVYLQVFQNSQREVGRLWQTNQISVAQEHFCTAATQMVMSQLYPSLFSGERKQRRVVMTCVGGELHEMGARMVADFLEMEGWDTYFLGANTPPDGVIEMVEKQNAQLLAISVTMLFHVSQARELIARLRAKPHLNTRVLVGGYPFNSAPVLWQQIGADGFAGDAQAAVLEAERLLA
jgi:methanogenic corrinoid protein MtbC1